MSQDLPSDTPRWTIPKRARMNNENLHISDFALVRKAKDPDSVLFLKAGEKFPVSFKRGKWLLPAAILDFGESPKKFAKNVLQEQLNNVDYLDPMFLSMQSYLGAHWDIVFVFEAHLQEGKPSPTPKEPFVDLTFLKLNALPKHEIASDHFEVLEELKKEP
jgi:hypothetical protein